MAFTLIHGAFGYLFGRFFTKDPFYLWVFFIYSMLPDLDGILFLWSRPLFVEFHRVVLHSLVMGAVAALLLVLIFRNRNAIWLFLAGFMGWGSHLFLDIMMTGSFMIPWFPLDMYKIWGIESNMSDPLSLVILMVFLCMLSIDLKAFRHK